MIFTLILLLYNLLFPLLFILYAPFYLRKLVKRGGFRVGFGERFGLFSAAKKEQLHSLRNPVWIHAVSVGETMAALSFIQRWTEVSPSLQVVLSTTTSTGQKLARDRAPANVTVIYCPIDFYPWVASALKQIAPSMLVIFEVEIWPNIITAARRRGIPLALVNGRMSDSSARGYAKYSPIFAPIFNSFDLIAVQTEEDAARMRRVIGDSDRIHVCNTMKFDQIADQKAGNVGELLDWVFPDAQRLIFLAASTHPGEEAIMAKVHARLCQKYPHLHLILVPRHAERSAAVEAEVQAENLSCIRLTQLRSRLENGPGDLSRQVLLVDTTGEMMNFLSAADIVFVGKTLGGNEGGHNIIEPAIFGKPIIHGAKMGNFRLVAQIFRERQAAIEVEDDAAFEEALERLLQDPEERQRLALASRATVDSQRGAIAKTIRLLEPLGAPTR